MKKQILALTCALALLSTGNGNSLTVEAAKKPISLSKNNITLKVGQTKKLNVKKTAKVKIKSKIFTSSNKKVATVTKKAGKIKAKKAGKATITVKVKYVKKPNKKKKTITLKCKVTVTDENNIGNKSNGVSATNQFPPDINTTETSTPIGANDGASSKPKPTIPISNQKPSASTEPTENPPIISQLPVVSQEPINPSPSPAADITDSRMPGLYNAKTGKVERTWDELIEEGILEVYDEEYAKGILRVSDGKESEIVGSLVISREVTEIDFSAFALCGALTEVTIPNTVTSIGYSAFAGCKGLKEIWIPDSVIYIAGEVFSECSNLAEIHISSTLTDFGRNPFMGTAWYADQISRDDFVVINGVLIGCNNIGENVRIPDRVTKIGMDVFSDCVSIINVNIPDGVTHIGERAFSRCERLENIQIPDSVTHIGFSAFVGCKGLQEIEIPASVVFIGGGAFSECINLTEIHIPGSITGFTDNPFVGTPWYERQKEQNDFVIINGVLLECNIDNEDIRIPDGVTHIGQSVFYGCKMLKSIQIPNSVTHIDTFAFTMCTNLKEIQIPDSVTHIAGNAFSACDSLTSIYIPASVVVIEEAKTSNPFCGCKGITEIIVDERNPVFDSRNNCNAIIETATNTLVTGCQASTIPDGVIRIKDDAFYRCRDTGIAIPSSVSEIGESSFEDVPWLVYDGIATGHPWGALEVRRSNGTIIFPFKKYISDMSKL